MGTNPGGGPVPYIITNNPCPSGSSPVALYVPDTALQTASDDQRQRIAVIQTEFAQHVSALLSRAYTDITEVLRSADSQPG